MQLICDWLKPDFVNGHLVGERGGGGVSRTIYHSYRQTIYDLLKKAYERQLAHIVLVAIGEGSCQCYF